MTVQEKLYTVEDLWRIPDNGKIYELHNGVIVEVAGSGERQSGLAAWIIYLLTGFIMQNNLGGMITGADGTFVLTPFNTRIPDAAYIREVQDERGFHRGAPDLAVEVVSPSNTPEEMQQRAGNYIDAGTRLVWIVDPEMQTVDVYRTDGIRHVLRPGDILEGYDVLPGLNLPVATVFNMFQR